MLADLFDVPRPPALELLVEAMLRTPSLWSIADTGAGQRDWIPPELRVFGRTGVDDGVVGVVLSCPEVEVPTWPVATFYRSEGVDRVHATCAAGALAFLSSWDEGTEELRRLLAEAEQPAVLPHGYLVRPTLDGLGLVVPIESCAADEPPEHRLSEAPEVVRELVRAGYAGSALHVGRDALAVVWRRGVVDLAAPLNAAVAEAYDALYRPDFARVARQRAGLEPRSARPTATVELDVDVAALVGDALPIASCGTATFRADGPIRGQVMLTLRAEVVLRSGESVRVLLMQGWNAAVPDGPLMGRVDSEEGRSSLDGLPGSLVPLAGKLAPRLGR